MKENKKIKHIWSLVCSNSLLDGKTNNLSLFNLVEKLTLTVPKTEMDKAKKTGAQGFLFPLGLEIMSRFYRQDNGETAFDYRLRFVNPEGKTIFNSERKIAVKKHIRNLRVGTNVKAWPISGSGDYTLVVEAKEVSENRYEEIASIPLEVDLVVKKEENKVKEK